MGLFPEIAVLGFDGFNMVFLRVYSKVFQLLSSLSYYSVGWNWLARVPGRRPLDSC
jgi:hypothetical protein